MRKEQNLQRKKIPQTQIQDYIKNVSSSRVEYLKKKQKKELAESRTPELAISLMIHTASMDHFLKPLGIKSYFESLTYCLSKQNFKWFELIYVDTFYQANKESFSRIIKKLPFQVKHVEIHPNHRYWYDKGHTYISAAKNTGILYADGQLCVTCDDAEFFPSNFLSTYWEAYKNNKLLLALHKRLKKIKTYKGRVVFPINGEEYVNDSRFEYIKDQNDFDHRYGNLAFAGTSFSLKDAIILNGFNEKMDGCKGLEDCDFGMRLCLINKEFTFSKEGFLYILEHPSYSENIKSLYSCEKSPVESKKIISSLIAIENYGMLQCSQKLMDIKANRGPITDKHIEIIKEETLRYRGFDPTDENHIDNFNIWLNCPCFDLEQERKELRNSGEWKWKRYLK
jgi:glycosyltransferase involved in cell wall biosynthesis